MNLERLRAVQAEEREADSLRPLADSFYREVATYLDELRSRRSAAAESADDPFGDEDVRRLTDEIETAEEVAEAIYERRVGKLVKRASLAAAGMPADEEGLTAEEAELFADLVDQIEAHRYEVLAAFEAGRSADAADESALDSSRAEAEGPLDATGGGDATTADEPGDGSAAPPPPPDEPTEGSATARDDDQVEPDDDTDDAGKDVDGTESTDGGGVEERVTLRITRDVGEVFGVDERVYDLSSEDVVTLPSANAKPLLDRDAAEKIS